MPDFIKAKKILVAPLDWGLGHATRCIPLIQELRQSGCEVLMGAEGEQAALLRQEFPDLTVLPLSGYRIKYNHGNSGYALKMASQLPRISHAVRHERDWLKDIVHSYQIDAVISDNRFGLHHPDIPCVIMTHQLHLKAPFSKWVENLLQKLNYRYLQKFNACWVVDFEGMQNLAGQLSHPASLPDMAVRYIGALSRFEYHTEKLGKYDVLVLISGPEPQRSLFENIILNQVRSQPLSTLIVSGKPGEPFDRQLTENVRHISHLNSKALNEAILRSNLVISRSGYTTIMDLIKLRKKAVLVPTPGQTEQEYLGKYLMEKKYFLKIKQKDFCLSKALQQVGNFEFTFPDISMNEYQKVIRDFIAQI